MQPEGNARLYKKLSNFIDEKNRVAQHVHAFKEYSGRWCSLIIFIKFCLIETLDRDFMH